MKYRKEKMKKEKSSLWQQIKDYFSTTKLNYYLNKTISPKNTYLVVLIIFSMFILISYFSYAMFTAYEEKQRVLSMQAGSLSSIITSKDFNESTTSVTIGARESKIIDINVTNNSIISAKVDLNCIKDESVSVSYLNDFSVISPDEEGSFVMNASESKVATISIINTSDEEKEITFKSDVGLANASLEASNTVVNTKTDNPYISGSLAYKLRSDANFMKDAPDFSKNEVSIDESRISTYKGVYVSGTKEDIEYTCPRGMVTSDKVYVDDLKYCVVENATCPSDSSLYKIEDLKTCLPYKKNTEDTFTMRTTKDSSNNIVYYYRGGSLSEEYNNIIEFASLKWKVVRINEDGTIKMILDDTIDKNIPYSYGNNKYKYTDSAIKEELDNWYMENLKNYESNIVNSNYCDDFSTSDKSDAYLSLKEEYSEIYGFTNRLKGVNTTSLKANEIKPTLACDENNIVNSKIGLLTMDELVMAGVSSSEFGTNNRTYNYLMLSLNGKTASSWWLMSPAYKKDKYFNYVVDESMGQVYTTKEQTDTTASIRPVITLKPGIMYVSGDGTYENPFIVK